MTHATPEGVPWWTVHEWLWDKLVPAEGPANTLQGELIRATGVLSGEAHAHANANWGDMHEALLALLAVTLDDAEVFDAQQRGEVRRAVDSIMGNVATPDLSGPGSALYYLSEMAVRWCLAQPEPIPV